MIGQIEAAEKETGEKINHLVLMGIGEPLDNFDSMLRFLKLVSGPGGRGIGMRNITLSTCGLADKIYELAKEHLGLTLAVSLHAPNDTMRRKIMPVDRRYPIRDLIKACRFYSKETGRRVTYEYALINGENDGLIHARELAGLIAGSLCHVNLIPVNEVKETGFKSVSKSKVSEFAAELEKNGVAVTVRRSLGQDINAARGQLMRDVLH
jgi:23S rRNA (adenine2503-C2)-methyltransferase